MFSKELCVQFLHNYLNQYLRTVSLQYFTFLHFFSWNTCKLIQENLIKKYWNKTEGCLFIHIYVFDVNAEDKYSQTLKYMSIKGTSGLI